LTGLRGGSSIGSRGAPASSPRPEKTMEPPLSLPPFFRRKEEEEGEEEEREGEEGETSPSFNYFWIRY